jgi:hypothetical protein
VTGCSVTTGCCLLLVRFFRFLREATGHIIGNRDRITRGRPRPGDVGLLARRFTADDRVAVGRARNASLA